LGDMFDTNSDMSPPGGLSGSDRRAFRGIQLSSPTPDLAYSLFHSCRPVGSFDVLKIDGARSDQGAIYGHVMQPEILRTLELYKNLFGMNEASLVERGKRVLEAVNHFDPDYVAMIEGVCAGSGIDSALIAAVNARTELLHEAQQGRDGIQAHECTSVALPAARLIGQNWDWMELLDPLMFVLDSTEPDGHRIVTLTEPGILGKIGMNSAGLGVCLNILPGKPPYDGVPVHILLRSVLDSRSLEAAHDKLSNAKHGTASSILVCNDQGEGFCAEIMGGRCHIERLKPDSAPLARTNHFLHSNEPVPPFFEDSPIRLERANMILREGNPEGDDLALLKRILSSRDDTDANICARFAFAGEDLGNVGSLASIIMDLKQGAMLIKRPHSDEGYSTHRVKPLVSA